MRTDQRQQEFRSTAEMRVIYRAERKVKRAGLGRVIARRVLSEQGTEEKVIVMLGAPRRVENYHWLCPYLIKGIVDSGVEYIPGEDSLQALLLAVEGMRQSFERSGRDLVWCGEGPQIPRQVPTHQGKQFEQRVALAIERESKRFWIGRLRERKEIRRAEASLRALKKGASRRTEPAAKANLKTKIREQEKRIIRAKKNTAKWETSLRKWKPSLQPAPLTDVV